MKGTVVQLDRGFPLVRTEEDETVRCEHATALVKGERVRAVIGDVVEVEFPEDHDKGVITAIEQRRTAFVRKDPTERTQPQVLAANFDQVMVVEPLGDFNEKRFERELVLAHQTGAVVSALLTKADLATAEGEVEGVCSRAQALAGADVTVIAISIDDAQTIERVRAMVPAHTMAILVGKSGVGKSSLINALAGREVRAVGAVRESDGAGRHTTVSRAIVDIPGGGAIVDMPGVRGLGLWDAGEGLDLAFPDVARFAEHCRFRDCRHESEPGCAVRAAVEAGSLDPARVESYRALRAESEEVRRRREEAEHLRGEKASDRKRGRAGRNKRR